MSEKMKKCKICPTMFVAKTSRAYCSDECRKIGYNASKYDFRERNREYYKEYHNKYNHTPQRKEYTGQYSRAIKMDVMDHYGGVCQCCGESELAFLTIDHIHGGGSKHRREIGSVGGRTFYRWLQKNNYPAGFQTLCMNCNLAKGKNGICPHKLDDTGRLLQSNTNKRGREYTLPTRPSCTIGTGSSGTGSIQTDVFSLSADYVQQFNVDLQPA